jgi:hypothetical protein
VNHDAASFHLFGVTMSLFGVTMSSIAAPQGIRRAVKAERPPDELLAPAAPVHIAAHPAEPGISFFGKLKRDTDNAPKTDLYKKYLSTCVLYYASRSFHRISSLTNRNR